MILHLQITPERFQITQFHPQKFPKLCIWDIFSNTGTRLTIFLHCALPKYELNFAQSESESEFSDFESYYSATDWEFDIPNSKFELQIPR